jgi:hypothetical protein
MPATEVERFFRLLTFLNMNHLIIDQANFLRTLFSHFVVWSVPVPGWPEALSPPWLVRIGGLEFADDLKADSDREHPRSVHRRPLPSASSEAPPRTFPEWDPTRLASAPTAPADARPSSYEFLATTYAQRGIPIMEDVIMQFFESCFLHFHGGYDCSLYAAARYVLSQLPPATADALRSQLDAYFLRDDSPQTQAVPVASEYRTSPRFSLFFPALYLSSFLLVR